MSVYKRKGSDAWNYSITLVDRFGVKDRERHSIPGVRLKSQAETVERHRRDEIFDKGWQAAANASAVPTFAEFIRDKFLPWSQTNKKSWKCDKYRAATLCRWFGEKELSSIAAFDVEIFKRERSKEGVSPITVNHELNVLRKSLNLAIDYGLLTDNPCKRVRWLKEPPNRERYLSDGELERLLAAASDYFELHALILLALNTGCRQNELMSLRREQIDWLNQEIRLTETKTRPRTVPLNDVAVEVLTLQLATSESEWLFPAKHKDAGNTHQKFPDLAWRRVVKRAEIEDARFHDLRHRFASDLGAAGVDAFTLAEILGHADLAMTRRYTHSQKETKRAAVEKLGRAVTECENSAYKISREIVKVESIEERRKTG